MSVEPIALLEDVLRSVEACERGEPIDVGALRGRIRHASDQLAAEGDDPRLAHIAPDCRLVAAFAETLLSVVERLEEGDADGALIALERAGIKRLEGDELPDERSDLLGPGSGTVA